MRGHTMQSQGPVGMATNSVSHTRNSVTLACRAGAASLGTIQGHADPSLRQALHH